MLYTEVIMHTFWEKIASKIFFLEVRTHRNSVPSAEEICETVESHALGNESTVVFLSRELPVRFFLDGTVYTTHRGGTRSGPLVLCYPEP